jgi:catechol 2,3-dioxygenase-like lactoylglutathione lyase family enzyme
MKATYKSVWPYQGDQMNLPVPDLEAALPYYESMLGFAVKSRAETPVKSAILQRDEIKIGLAENGGDPTQDGCFFGVDNVEAAFAELKANGLERENAEYRIDKYGDKTWRVFFLVAPDGLCFCIGERVG